MALPRGTPPMPTRGRLGPPPCPAAGAVAARRRPARRSLAARRRAWTRAPSELEQDAEERRAALEIVTLHLLVDAEVGRPGAGELGGQPRLEAQVAAVRRLGGDEEPL